MIKLVNELVSEQTDIITSEMWREIANDLISEATSELKGQRTDEGNDEPVELTNELMGDS